MMVRPVLVRPLQNYRIYLEFSDGAKEKWICRTLWVEVFFKFGTITVFSGESTSVLNDRLNGMITSNFALIRFI